LCPALGRIIWLIDRERDRKLIAQIAKDQPKRIDDAGRALARIRYRRWQLSRDNPNKEIGPGE
jgi:hypothetical protein